MSSGLVILGHPVIAVAAAAALGNTGNIRNAVNTPDVGSSYLFDDDDGVAL